jgi:hypothetical protein
MLGRISDWPDEQSVSARPHAAAELRRLLGEAAPQHTHGSAMRYEVVTQPRAERDIRTVALGILGQSRSKATALRWARNLRATIATLKTNPQ